MQKVQSVGAQLGSIGLASDATTSRLYVRGSFEVRCETQWGDFVVITGNTEQLGNWRPDRALRMTTDPGAYPVWHCEPLLRCVADEIEFKFVVVHEDGTFDWEPLPGNRRLLLPTQVDDVQVVADWGAPSVSPHGQARAAIPGSPIARRAISPPQQHTPGATPPASGCSSAAGSVHGGHAGRSHSPGLEADDAARSAGLTERLLVVMHHLPLSIQRDGESGGWTVEWDESSLLTTSAQGGRHLLGGLNLEVIFVGMPKATVPVEAQPEVAEKLQQFNCVPVWLPHSPQVDYTSFGSLVLWPLLHNQLPDRCALGAGPGRAALRLVHGRPALPCHESPRAVDAHEAPMPRRARRRSAQDAWAVNAPGPCM